MRGEHSQSERKVRVPHSKEIKSKALRRGHSCQGRKPKVRRGSKGTQSKSMSRAGSFRKERDAVANGGGRPSAGVRRGVARGRAPRRPCVVP
eukprot:2363063-Pleurochrysis_carterae.AAC.1